MTKPLLLRRRGLLAVDAAPVGAAYAAEVLADSPLGYWRLSETAGASLADETGTYDAVVTGSPTLDTPGRFGSGMTGFTTTDYGITPTIGTLGNTPNVSFELWLKWTSTAIEDPFGVVSGNQIGFFHCNAGDNETQNEPGRVTFRRRNTSGKARHSARNDLNDGEWHHVVGTQAGATADPTLYVDGVVDHGGLWTHASVGAAAFTRGFAIGASNGNGTITRPFSGVVDEVAVYNVALSGARVAAHYAARLLP